jgi:hypothetical protein
MKYSLPDNAINILADFYAYSTFFDKSERSMQDIVLKEDLLIPLKELLLQSLYFSVASELRNAFQSCFCNAEYLEDELKDYRIAIKGKIASLQNAGSPEMSNRKKNIILNQLSKINTQSIKDNSLLERFHKAHIEYWEVAEIRGVVDLLKKYYKMKHLIQPMLSLKKGRYNYSGIPKYFIGSPLRYLKAFKFFKKRFKDDESMIYFAQSCFRYLSWDHDYGGTAWEAACVAWRKLNRSKSIGDIIVAIDHIFDLQHNTGFLLNKVFLFSDSFFLKTDPFQYNKDFGDDSSMKRSISEFMWDFYYGNENIEATYVETMLSIKAKSRNPWDLLEFCSDGMRKIASKNFYKITKKSLVKYESTRHLNMYYAALINEMDYVENALKSFRYTKIKYKPLKNIYNKVSTTLN